MISQPLSSYLSLLSLSLSFELSPLIYRRVCWCARCCDRIPKPETARGATGQEWGCEDRVTDFGKERPFKCNYSSITLISVGKDVA